MTDFTQVPRIAPKLVLFDVFETLLDMSPVRSKFNSVLNSSKAYQIWFELTNQYAFVDIITGQFHDFALLSKEAIRKVSKLFRHTAEEQLNEEILLLMKHAPLYEDVQPVLSALTDKGIQLAAFSNVSKTILRERMENTGLVSYFNFILSAEDIGHYKPSREAYAAAVKKANFQPQEIVMVSSHWWDLRGAHSAGLQTILLQRSTDKSGMISELPALIIKDLSVLGAEWEQQFIDPVIPPFFS